jgi:hypothetical protein
MSSGHFLRGGPADGIELPIAPAGDSVLIDADPKNPDFAARYRRLYDKPTDWRFDGWEKVVLRVPMPNGGSE